MNSTLFDIVEAHNYVVELLGELFVEQIVERSSQISGTINATNQLVAFIVADEGPRVRNVLLLPEICELRSTILSTNNSPNNSTLFIGIIALLFVIW